METIPPITLISVALMIICYLNPANLFHWSGLASVCISADSVLNMYEWKRVLMASIFHGDDMHLYYNMISFFFKSRELEPRFGARNYAFLLLALSITTNIVYIGINVLLANCIAYHYMYHCAVGFSGVIFALKVILAHFTPNVRSNVMGLFQVPIAYASWLELVLISFLVPNASFVGHLSGILVGIIFIWGYSTFVLRRNYFYGQPERVGTRSDVTRRTVETNRREDEKRRKLEIEMLEKRENEMFEEAKKRSLEDIKNLLPGVEVEEREEKGTELSKNKNAEANEREELRRARIARFQKY